MEDRRVAGFVDTLAGQCGVPGFADGAPTSARFSEVHDVFCSPYRCQLLVADVGNHRIRAVTKDPRDCTPPAPPQPTLPGVVAIISCHQVSAWSWA